MSVEERDYYPIVAQTGIAIARNYNQAIDISYIFELREWIDCNREFDILIAFRTPGRREPRLISIEVKQDSNASTLFHQGIVRMQIADYVYLAFPLDHLSYYWHKATEYKIHELEKKKKFNFGLMVVDYPHKKTSIMNYARMNKSPRVHAGWKMKVFNKVMNEGKKLEMNEWIKY